MNDTWDLSILYKGFDDPAFTGDMAALDAAIRSMNDPGGPGRPPCPTLTWCTAMWTASCS